MAGFRTTFVAAVLLYFSCSLLIGCAQQYEEDYSAEVRFANWQSTKTRKARIEDAPSPLDVKNSSPTLTTRNRPGTRISYEEVTHQYKEQEEPLQRASETVRQRPRTRQGIRKFERRTDDVRETASERRGQNRIRTTESTTNTPQFITPKLRVPLQEAPVKLPKGFSLENRRQRIKQEPSTTEASPLSSPRPFSRGRVKAKIIENPRKSTKNDDVSESDNYPPGFIEKIKKSEENPSTADVTGPRRSHLRQRAAKSYPAIAISEANRFRQKYPRVHSSTDKSQEGVTAEAAISTRNESRQRSRIRYTTTRTTAENKIKPFRSYGRRFTTTEKNENTTQVYTTTISPRQKYLYRLRKGNKLIKTTTEKVLDEQKKEALEPAENLFYVYPENGNPKGDGTFGEQKMKNFEGDLEPEASEEDKTVDTSKSSESTAITTTAAAATTATTTTATATATSSIITTTTKAAPPVTINELKGASLSTRHRFSSRFSRSNKTTVPDDVTPAIPALVADIQTSPPLNLTSMFDEAPDNTLSVMNLFNNSFAASTVTNKTISPDSKTTTTRPSTVTINSSTKSQTNTTTKRPKKKSQNKKSKKSNKTTTASPISALNDRPILRNLASLFAGPETTTKRNGARKRVSKTTSTTTTTTITTAATTTSTTLKPQEISQIQSYINETMELVQNKTGVPASIRVVPRGDLNALTPETSIEDTTTQPTSTTSTTTAAASTAMTTSKTETPSPKTNCTSQYVFFDYNSTAPIPKQFENARRITATTPTTTTSTTADYFVYGVYPNNTIVRKRAFKAFDYEKYHSPYVIFGIYPNNTIVKKFPNGTIINDEYMTVDNEIRDIMSGSTQKTISTSSRIEATTVKQGSTTAGMKMAGSGTSESRIEDERATTTENPNSMFEILENEIEDEERNDGRVTATTESFDLENFELQVPENVTTEAAGETTEMPVKFLEDIEETTIESTTSMNSREGKSFYLNDVLGENVVESTTEQESTTNSRESTTYMSTGNIPGSTTESSREGKSFLFSDIFGENIIDSTTEKTRTTENIKEGPFYGGGEIDNTTEKTGTTESAEQDKSIRFNDILDEKIVTSTSEKTEITTENTTGDKSSDKFDENLVESTTYRNGITTENNREAKLYDISINFDGENFAERTTEKAGSTTIEGEVIESNDALSGSTTEKLEKTTTERNLLEFNDIFGESVSEIANNAEGNKEYNSKFDTNSVGDTEITRENTRGGKSFDLFGENVVESTTSVTTESKLFVLNDVFTENAIDSTTEKTGTDFNGGYKSSLDENVSESSTEKSVTTTENTSEQFLAKLVFDTSADVEKTGTSTLDSIDLKQLFQPTTTRYDSSLFDIDIRSGDGPVYRPSTEAVDVSTAVRSIFGSYEDSSTSSELSATISYPSSVTEASTERNSFTTQASNFEVSDADVISTTERRNSHNLNEVLTINGELSTQSDIQTGNTKSTVEQDEPSGLVNLAFRVLGSSVTITPYPNYITSTMKSMNYAEKKVRLKKKRTSTTTAKPENVIIVTPETREWERDVEIKKKGRVKFVTLTPGVVVTTNFRDGNDVMTMSSQHVQKVTKAPANLPDNILKSVVGEIQEKSSSPIPEIIKNVEKELQGNGISVSLARRIIEMAIERSVTTVTPQTTGRTSYFTTEITTTSVPTTVPSTTPTTEITTAYELLNTINLNPLSVGLERDYVQSTTSKKDEIFKEPSTTFRTTTKTAKKTKSSRNSAAMSTLSENDKLLLEAILKQQNSDLSVQEIDKIIENQIRLAEEVRKASKNLKKKPRLTTTTTTTTQTPPLFGFLISLFSGNSSPSNIPVTRAPIKQTRSRVKSSRARGSMTNTPKSINPDPLKEADEGISSGERSTRGELVTAAIDVTKAVSKFMGTFFSSAAQSFQAFFSNFGRGR